MDSKEQDYKLILQKAAKKIKELNAQIDGLRRESEIAIIGYDCCFPGGASNPDKYWECLKRGYDAVREIPKERFDVDEFYSEDRQKQGTMYTKYGAFLDNDISEFDNTHFEMIANEAESVDPQHRLLMELSWRAMENSGLDIPSLRGSNTGVFLGLSSAEYSRYGIASPDFDEITPYSLFGAAYSAAAGRMAYYYDFKGPAVVNDSACSSSLVALNNAVNCLKTGECDLAIVGAANIILNPSIFIGLSRIQALAPDGRCKVFDNNADGFGRGEGCGILILKRLDDAIRDHNTISAIVKSSAIGQDGKANGFYAPNGIAEERVMKRALDLSGYSSDDIDYIEAHGTGTVLGDYIETQAISNVYQSEKGPILVGSVKSNIGHLEAAAGIAGLIKILLSMKNGQIPPSINYKEPNQNIDNSKIKVVSDLTDWKKDGKRIAGINSFGITGTLAHVILEEYKAAPEAETQKIPVGLLTLSAQNANALKRSMSDMLDYLEGTSNRLTDVLYTTNKTRSHLPFRYAMPATKKEDLCKALRQAIESNDVFEYETKKAQRRSEKTAFLFTGQGSVYRNIGRQLYDYSSEFRQTFTMCDKRFEKELGISVYSVVYGDKADMIDQPLCSQPLIFTVEYSLLQIWEKLGFHADIVVGHSIGEITAACCAGAITFDDAVSMIVSRARLMQSVDIKGKMVGIMTDEATVQSAIEASGCKNVSIAAVNAPRNVTLSGTEEEVDRVIEKLQQGNRVFINDLKIIRPYHSALMIPYESDYSINIEGSSNSKVKYISGLKGRQMNSDELHDNRYWASLLSGCVDFKSAVTEAYKAGARIFIEIGGTATLTALAKQNISNEDCIYVATLRNNDGESFYQIMEALKELYLNGVSIDWDRFYETYRKQEVTIPPYPFKRKKLWKETKTKYYMKG